MISKITPDLAIPAQHEEVFQEILRLYDLTDDVLAAIAREGISNRKVQSEIATPFVTQVSNSANILSTFYTEVVQRGKAVTPELQDTFESAFRNIFVSLQELAERADSKLKCEDVVNKSELKATPEREISALAQKIRQLPSGSLQSKLYLIASQVPTANGRELVEAAHALGDHAAGLATVFQSMGFVRLDKALPVLGRATPIARGAGLVFDESGRIVTMPTILDPNKVKISNN